MPAGYGWKCKNKGLEEDFDPGGQKHAEKLPHPAWAFVFAVLGFGSTHYPDFCQYAPDVEQQLASLEATRPLLELEKVNHANKAAFFKWVNQLSEVLQLELKIDTRLLAEKKEKEISMRVMKKSFLRIWQMPPFYWSWLPAKRL